LGISEVTIYQPVVKALVIKLNEVINVLKTSKIAAFNSTLLGCNLLSKSNSPEVIFHLAPKHTKFYVEERKFFTYQGKNLFCPYS